MCFSEGFPSSRKGKGSGASLAKYPSKQPQIDTNVLCLFKSGWLAAMREGGGAFLQFYNPSCKSRNKSVCSNSNTRDHVCEAFLRATFSNLRSRLVANKCQLCVKTAWPGNKTSIVRNWQNFLLSVTASANQRQAWWNQSMFTVATAPLYLCSKIQNNTRRWRETGLSCSSGWCKS